MNRRFIYVIILALAVGLVGGILINRYTSQRVLLQVLRTQMAQQQLNTSKLETTLQLIDGYYVDSIKVDTLIESMMPKLIERLDPHSAYIPAKDMSKVNESLDGEFDGIGVVFNMATDTVIILNVIPAGPSAKAGIMARDRIIKIDGDSVAGQKVAQDSIMKRLRGERGTKVKLGIERVGVDELLDIEVTRGKIPIHSIGATMMIDDKVGYINMSQFARTTYEEFIAAINKLAPQGMESLILDLRGNSGGFFDQAISIATEFLPKGAPIVYTEDRDGNQEKEYSQRDGQMQDLGLVVLIDEGSASSSEIVAGAIQDNDRGTIIGRRSFGKGLIQRQIPFSDGSAIRITTARYFTPTGRSIQKPYKLGDVESYDNEIMDRIAHDELFSKDSIAFADSLKFTTPGGKVVYGGGGIMPDIFVPVSKEKLPKLYLDITMGNILYKYTIDYSDRHRDELAAIESFEDLDSLFAGDPHFVDDFLSYAKRNDFKWTPNELALSRELIELQLKAFIGRNTVLEDNGYIMNIYPIDDTVMRALKELEEQK